MSHSSIPTIISPRIHCKPIWNCWPCTPKRMSWNIPYASTTARQKPTVIRPEHAKSRITPDGHTAKATYIVMLGTKSINARCGSLSASRKADGMRMSSPSRPYCAKHDTSCVRTKGYIIIAVAKALSPTPCRGIQGSLPTALLSRSLSD